MPENKELTQIQKNIEKLKRLLTELFQFESSDLDFGIYRIINQKQTIIRKYIDKELVESISQQCKDINATSEETAEIFDHIYQFFSRYYDKGDYMPLHRHSLRNKNYAVPWNGEEVVLHWANKDQYYIKTGGNFKDFIFHDEENKFQFHFTIIDSQEPVNNVKQEDHYFILSGSEDTVEYDDTAKKITVRFTYDPLNKDEAKRRSGANSDYQKAFRTAAERQIVEQLEIKAKEERSTARKNNILTLLAILNKREKRKNVTSEDTGTPTFLTKKLNRYVQENKSDYFIHKDLGGFLKQELDTYIKREMWDLNDLIGTAKEIPAPDQLKAYTDRIRIMRNISLEIITFLAQIEDFQKRLFLKKKFVLSTDYCITLDHIPKKFYKPILENEDQIAEWKRLFGIGDTDGQSTLSGDKINQQFLDEHQNLVIDTKFFSQDLKEELLENLLDQKGGLIDDLDATIGGLLVKSENWQALNLLQERYLGQVKCIYIDPPYNRGTNEFLYKDNYMHSSWLSMMYDRLDLSARLLQDKGVIFSSIDENERDSLQAGLDLIFGRDNRIEELIWAQNTTHSQVPLYSTNHEYVEVYARNRGLTESDPAMFKEPKPGYFEIMTLVAELNPRYPKISEIEKAVADLYKQHIEEYKEELREMGLEYNEETKKQDPWRGIYLYSYAEYINAKVEIIPESHAEKTNARIAIWQEGDASAPAQKQAESIRDPKDPNFRFYKPLHPKTGKPCAIPKSGWRWPFSWPDESRENFESLNKKGRIAWGDDEKKVPRYKRYIHEVETNVAKSVFHDYTDGEKQLAGLFGGMAVFSTTKPTTLPARFITQTCKKTDLVLDFFVGSGTTGHAVIDLNREDNGSRKYILIEMADYFHTILKPRIQKVMYSNKWKDGKPLNTEGYRHIFKYITLEQYEDTLNNIAFTQRTLDVSAYDDYLIEYMLDFETKESPCRFGITTISDPWAYQLKFYDENIPKMQNVDLIETFNYLIGIHVKGYRTFTNGETRYRVVIGSKNDTVIVVIWRKMQDLDLTVDKEFIENTILPAIRTVCKRSPEKIYINAEFYVKDALPIEPEFFGRMGG